MSHPAIAEINAAFAARLRAGETRLGAIFAAAAEGMKPYMRKGYTLPIAGMDLMLRAAAARGVVQELK